MLSEHFFPLNILNDGTGHHSSAGEQNDREGQNLGTSLHLAATVWALIRTEKGRTITLYYDRVRYIEDGTALSQTADAHRLWFDVLAYGLGMRMAEKWNEPKVGLLKGRFKETKEAAGSALVPRGPVMIYGVSGQRARRRRA